MVTALGLVPVKGLQAMAVDALDLQHDGAAGDRAFVVVGEDGALLVTERNPVLSQVRAGWDGETLTLGLPDGDVAAVPEPGAAVQVALYDGRPLPGRVVDGPLSAALSDFLGRPVRLVQRDAGHFGADDAPVSLMSNASAQAVAPAADRRRFRMNITVDGVDAFAEDRWSEIAVGDARLRVVDAIPRCVVTTRDPETGARDLGVLHALAKLRGKDMVCLGVWCEVVEPGRVRIGDAVTAR